MESNNEKKSEKANHSIEEEKEYTAYGVIEEYKINESYEDFLLRSNILKFRKKIYIIHLFQPEINEIIKKIAENPKRFIAEIKIIQSEFSKELKIIKIL